MVLTLSWRRPLSYRNQSIDLLRKLMDWFLYDNDLRHERVNGFNVMGFSLHFLSGIFIWYYVLTEPWTGGKSPLISQVSEKTVLEWKHTLLFLWLLPLRSQIDVAICTSTSKTFKQTFSFYIGTFVWWYVDCTTRGLHIRRLKRRNNKKILCKKIVLASEYYYTCVNDVLLIFSHKFITWKLSPDRV